MPAFALLPAPVPQRGILCSTLLHITVLAALPFLSQMLPPPVLLRSPSDVSLTYEPITFDALPTVSDSGSGHEGGSPGGSSGRAGGQEPRRGTPAAPKAAQAAPATSAPKMLYEGPQEIISNSPNPTNTVQTIRRPDLLNAPKLKFAVKVQSMVVTAAAAVPVLAVPAPAAPAPEPVAPELAVVPAPTVAYPVLPVRVPQQRAKVANVEPPKLRAKVEHLPVPDVRNRPLPVLAQDESGSGTKTALVVNAVNVPADAPKDVPDAEISGSFAVMPLRKIAEGNLIATAVGPPANGSSGTGTKGNGTAATGTGAGGTDPKGTGSGGTPTGKGAGLGSGGSGTGSGAGAGNGTGMNGAGNGTGSGRGSGSGVGDGAGRGSGRGTGSGSGTGSGNGYGAGSGSGTGSGNGGAAGSGSGTGRFPGITIVGGTGSGAARGGSRGGAPARVVRPGYDMTIISGGTSGGATRDMGVFGRNETVYTVYVTMADVGGGPACPMQYALLDLSMSGGGVLTPPYAKKKVAALATDEQLGGRYDAQPVFLSATIDEEGRLQNVRALAPQDPRSAIALAAFDKWEFLPAQIGGRAVSTRVLIGITVLRSHEDKQGN